MIFSNVRYFLLIYFICGFSYLSVKAQESFSERDSLTFYLNKISDSRNDVEKKELNKKVRHILVSLLKNKETILLELDSVPHIGKLVSADKNLKIINWNLVYEDGTFEYFGYILHFNPKTNVWDEFSLNDKSKEIKQADEAVLTSQTWLGALYYQIIETEYRKKKYYTLLGWDGFDEFKNRKIIEILYFSEAGSPKFGAQIFNKGPYHGKMRIIFEYTNRASMALLYDERVNRIVFDHLSPSEPAYKDQYQYYGPDGSYDALRFKRGKWLYQSDFDIRNSKDLSNKIKKPSDKF